MGAPLIALFLGRPVSRSLLRPVPEQLQSRNIIATTRMRIYEQGRIVLSALMIVFAFSAVRVTL